MLKYILNKYLKEVYYKDSNMTIFKELKGKTIDLLSEEERDKYSDIIIDSLIEYFNSISKIKVKGYGILDSNLSGKYNSFIEFLHDRQNGTSDNLKDYEDLSNIASIIFNKYDYLIKEDNSLAPIDTNMKNIMIDNEQVKFIDPGEMISGPILISYGDFVAHTYKTKYYYKLISKLNLSSDEEKLLRIYAIFSSLNILSFLHNMGVSNLKEVIPYGNTETFYNLIYDYLKQIDLSN